MHFEILVEDQSGKKALEFLVPKIVESKNTFRIVGYRGIGRIPSNLSNSLDASRRQLLDQLPRLLGGYGRTYASTSTELQAAVIVVCDLDDKCMKSFRKELLDVLKACNPKPITRFCLAIEEGEAWLLGDSAAVRKAYPGARVNVLEQYENDAICGTWELLADAVYTGGSQGLKKRGWMAVGREKSAWSEQIAPHIDVDRNASPSFQYFKEKLQELT